MPATRERSGLERNERRCQEQFAASDERMESSLVNERDCGAARLIGAKGWLWS